MFSCIFREGNIYKNLCGDSGQNHRQEKNSNFSGNDSLIGKHKLKRCRFCCTNAKDAQKEWAKIPISEKQNIIHKAARIMENTKKKLRMF